eukprot:12980569-Alexandrium_andersonii.AAC.1
MAASVVNLRDGPDIVARPHQLDEVMRREWGKIYEGNGDPYQVAASFAHTHAPYMPQHQEFAVPELT